MSNRLYISADIEGIAGVVNGNHLMPGGFEYEQAREWMTAEVVAACNAAFESGIEEIVVSDSHGNGQNILLDKLPDNVQLVRSQPRPLIMMEGIDIGEYIGALFIGYHTGGSDLRGVLAHTLHGGAISELRINGRVASETVLSALTAAHFKVPVIMVSGDDAYVEHAEKELAGPHHPLETVTTKWAYSTTSARMIKPNTVQAKIGEAVKRAILNTQNPENFPIPELPEEIVLELQCLQRQAVELIAYLPYVERLDAYTFKFVAKDMVEACKFLRFVLKSGALTLKA